MQVKRRQTMAVQQHEIADDAPAAYPCIAAAPARSGDDAQSTPLNLEPLPSATTVLSNDPEAACKIMCWRYRVDALQVANEAQKCCRPLTHPSIRLLDLLPLRRRRRVRRVWRLRSAPHRCPRLPPAQVGLLQSSAVCTTGLHLNGIVGCRVLGH